MKRGDLADALEIRGKAEAHHIIPVEILGEQEVLRELVKSGWDFNAKVNGVPLAEGFHGNHPAYTQYVRKRVSGFMRQYNATPVADAVGPFKTFLENVLIPELLNHIQAAKKEFKASGQTLNGYFARLR
jgi:hypothetical protein